MRLLVLAPTYPYPVMDGTQVRIHNLFRRFTPDIQTTLLCFDQVESIREESLSGAPAGFGSATAIRVPRPAPVTGFAASTLAQIPRREAGMIWKFRSPIMEEQVRRHSMKADAVLIISLQMGAYLQAIPSDTPTILDNYNQEWLILDRMAGTRPIHKRWFWKLEAAKLRNSESEFLRAATSVIAISEIDQEGMRKLAPNARFSVVPNGVDESFFELSEQPLPTGPPRFAMVGAFNWHVNEDAAVWLCREIWPRVREELPEATLSLVGRDPSPTVRELAQLPGVRVTGTVADVRPYLQESTALLVPLRYGSGIRNKILEGFAAGRPLVSTRVGAEGLPVESGRHLLLEDEASGFAAACVRLARDRSLADRMVAAGSSLVRELDEKVTHQFRDALARSLPAAKVKP